MYLSRYVQRAMQCAAQPKHNMIGVSESRDQMFRERFGKVGVMSVNLSLPDVCGSIYLRHPKWLAPIDS